MTAFERPTKDLLVFAGRGPRGLGPSRHRTDSRLYTVVAGRRGDGSWIDLAATVAGSPDWAGRPVVVVTSPVVPLPEAQLIADYLACAIVVGNQADGWWLMRPRRAEATPIEPERLDARREWPVGSWPSVAGAPTAGASDELWPVQANRSEAWRLAGDVVGSRRWGGRDLLVLGDLEGTPLVQAQLLANYLDVGVVVCSQPLWRYYEISFVAGTRHDSEGRLLLHRLDDDSWLRVTPRSVESEPTTRLRHVPLVRTAVPGPRRTATDAGEAMEQVLQHDWTTAIGHELSNEQVSPPHRYFA